MGLSQVKSEQNSQHIDDQSSVKVSGTGELKRRRKRKRSSLGEHQDFQPRPKRSRYCVKEDRKLCYVVFADECYVEKMFDHKKSGIVDVLAEGAVKDTFTVDIERIEIKEQLKPVKLFKSFEKLNIFHEVAESMRKEKMFKAVHGKQRIGRDSSRGDDGSGMFSSLPGRRGDSSKDMEDSLEGEKVQDLKEVKDI